MSRDTTHIGPHRRIVFTNDGMLIEHEQRAEVGTTWKSVASFNDDELRDIATQLDKHGYNVSE